MWRRRAILRSYGTDAHGHIGRVRPETFSAMATLIPSLGSARFDSRGELRPCLSASRTSSKTTPSHNLPMGPRGRHPDFVIVHPSNGMLVLEVKDWRLDTIASANKSEVELVTTRGVVRESSPFEQARRYMFDVVQQIQKDGQLLFPAGHAFQGKPIVPFGFGVVFTNITRKQYDQTNLREVFPEDRCLLRTR
jgi:hypothetical protein